MGNFCLATPGPSDIPSDIPVIYGDLLDRETRFLIAMLDLSGEPRHFIPIDTIEGG